MNEVSVSLEDKKAVIKTDKEISDSEIKDIIKEAGYEVIEIKQIFKWRTKWKDIKKQKEVL